MKVGYSLAWLSLLPMTTLAQEHCELANEHPNIVCIFMDDHAFQTISAYGYPISKIAPTPNIDRLAEHGMLFRQSFVENSISGPSRATLLTGLYSHQHGQTRLGCCLDDSKTFFTELLQKAGYKTSVFGKWHLNVDPKGFDYYHILFDQGEYYNPSFRTPDTNGQFIKEKGYVTRLITDHAIDWLDTIIPTHQPFCILVNHKDPHRNWMPDLSNLNQFNDVDFPEPSTLFDDYESRGPQMQMQELTIAEHMGYAFDFKVEELKDEPTFQYIKDSWPLAMKDLTEEERRIWDEAYRKQNEDFLKNRPEGKDLVRWKYQRYVKDYCRTIRSVDEQVGRLLDYLDSQHILDNTIIVYTSDQGFLMGEHGLYDKRFMYEESFRTPLIISYPPMIKAGSQCGKFVQNIDLAPTFLSVAGIKPPKEMVGMSLVLLFENGTSSRWRDNLYYQFYDYPAVGTVRKHYGIRTERYKLIHWYGYGENGDSNIDYWELFDLKKDSMEIHNVYADKKYMKIRQDMTDLLKKKRIEIGVIE